MASRPVLTMAAGKALALLAPLLEGLEVCVDQMHANLDATRGYPLSEGVMLALARHIGKQTAHRIIHQLVASARPQGMTFRDAIMSDADIRAHLNERNSKRCSTRTARSDNARRSLIAFSP